MCGMYASSFLKPSFFQTLCLSPCAFWGWETKWENHSTGSAIWRSLSLQICLGLYKKRRGGPGLLYFYSLFNVFLKKKSGRILFSTLSLFLAVVRNTVLIASPSRGPTPSQEAALRQQLAALDRRRPRLRLEQRRRNLPRRSEQEQRGIRRNR